MHPGLIGGIAGSVIGLAGGIIGTYCTVKNVNGPKERAFVRKAALIGWIIGLAFLALLFFLPGPWKWLVWAPYSIVLAFGIRGWNKRQEEIRREESRAA